MKIKFLIILLILTISTSCSSKIVTRSESNQNEYKNSLEENKTIKYSLWSAPAGVFLPCLIDSDYTFAVVELIFDRLVILNPELNFEPALAESWEVSDDSKTILFKLRKGVKWHDGEEFNADDVIFTYMFIAHPNYPGSRYSTISPILGIQDYKDEKVDYIEGIKKIDDYTISITTDEVFAPFFANILGSGMEIIPEHIWKDIDPANAFKETELLRNPIGTGPFKIKRFVADQYVSFVKYDDYWGGTPKVDELIIQVINQDTAQIQMINGEIDIMSLSSMHPDDLALYEAAGIQIQESYFNAFQHIGVNHKNELLNIREVRQAMAYAIDRQGIVDSLLHGYGNVANTAFPINHWGYPENDENIENYEYDPEKAIEILTEQVGWEFKDGTMYANGEPVKWVLVYPTGNKARELSAPVIQENLGQVGIEIELQIMDFNTMSHKIDEDEFDLYMMGNGFSIDPDISMYFHTNAMINEHNNVHYSNPELDKLLEEGVKYISIEERRPTYNQISEILNRDMPTIFLYNWSEGTAISSRLKGVQTFAFGDFYNVHNWYIEE